MVEWRARARVRAVSASDWGAPSNDPPRIDLTRRRGPSRVALDFFYFLLFPSARQTLGEDQVV